MKKLLKEYGFSCFEQYYSMVVESFLNGQPEQAKEQFKALSKADRKECFMYSVNKYGLNTKSSKFLLNLL